MSRNTQFFCSFLLTLLFCLPILANATRLSAPTTFTDAKLLLREHVYFDQHQNGALGTFYCGCDWRWTGATGGRVNLTRCGYKVRAQAHRAQRIEWEHLVPVSLFGRQRQCWQKGGRRYCSDNDPLFSLMEADMHNLVPVIGEVNADRSNFRFGLAPAAPALYGACTSRVDFKKRIFEPRSEVRGMIARINFYMHDRYDLRMSKQQQQLFIQWHKAYPVTPWELERNRRIKTITGQDNPFVTGVRQWQLDHKNSVDGLRTPVSSSKSLPNPQTSTNSRVKGNRNSKIYHLPHCPNYADVSPRNSVSFSNEQQARFAGYRKAYNCR